VRTIQDLSRRSIYSLATEDLDGQVQRILGRRKATLQPTAYEITIYFGQTEAKDLKEVARQIFEAFRCAAAAGRVPPARHLAHRRGEGDPGERADRGRGERLLRLARQLSLPALAPASRAPALHLRLAILHDPDEAMSPSNRRRCVTSSRRASPSGSTSSS